MNETVSVGINSSESYGKKFIILLSMFILVGVVIGTLAICRMEVNNVPKGSYLTQEFLMTDINITLVQFILNNLKFGMLIIIICMFLGLCAIAQPVLICLLIYRGIGLGLSIAYYYILYGFKGGIISFILILPGAIISTFALIIGVRESIKMSNMVLGVIIGNKKCGISDKSCIKLYVLKFIILFAIILIASIIQGLLEFFFSRILLL